MGVCTRRANVVGASVYAWQGWNFMVLIGMLIAIGLFYYNYIDMFDPSAAGEDSDVTIIAVTPPTEPEAEDD